MWKSLQHTFTIRVATKKWIDSPKFKQILIERNPEVTVDEISELVESMAQALCVTIVRNWMEVAEIHMLYVAKSPERPFGRLKRFGGDTSIRVKRATLVISIACCGLMALMRMKSWIEYEDLLQN